MITPIKMIIGLLFYFSLNFFCNAAVAATNPQPPMKCVEIYYDRIPNDLTYTTGRIDALYIQNLIGHFPHFQQYIIPIKNYKIGDLDKCQASIYIGSHYNGVKYIPKSFYADFVKTKKNVLWLQYGIEQVGKQNLQKIWGVQYQTIDTGDKQQRNNSGKPSFYIDYTYKGEIFHSTNQNDVPTETVVLKPMASEAKDNVVSWASNPSDGRTIPYILHKNNHWYVADIPSLRAMERRSRGRVVCGRLRFANQPAGMCSKSLCSRKAICGSCVCSTHTVVLRRTS